MNDYKFLCKIKHLKKYDYQHASNIEKDALDRLIKSGHVTYEFDKNTNHSICKITSLGENYIYNENKENYKWKFTSLISILALLISSLTLLVQLLK